MSGPNWQVLQKQHPELFTEARAAQVRQQSVTLSDLTQTLVPMLKKLIADQMQAVQQEAATAMAEMASLRRTNDAMQIEIDGLRADIAMLRGNRDSQLEAEQAMAEIAALRREIADLRTKASEPAAESEVALAEISALRAEIADLRTSAVGINYVGVWRPDAPTPYARNMACTWDGSLWIALRDTDRKPGTDDSGWQLAVKRGQAGRDAPSITKGRNYSGVAEPRNGR